MVDERSQRICAVDGCDEGYRIYPRVQHCTLDHHVDWAPTSLDEEELFFLRAYRRVTHSDTYAVTMEFPICMMYAPTWPSVKATATKWLTDAVEGPHREFYRKHQGEPTQKVSWFEILTPEQRQRLEDVHV